MRTTLTAVLFLCCSPVQGISQTNPQSGASLPRADSVSVSGMARHFVSSLGFGLSAPSRWNANTLVRFAGATAIVATISTADGYGRDAMLRNQSDVADALTSFVEPLGSQASFPVIAVFAVSAVAFHNGTAASVASDAAASSIIAGGIITPALKLAFGRPRPRENEKPYTFRPFSGEASFPSGHTTQAFAIASVIATEYDEPWVKITAYGLATGVGVSRMYHGAHFASDVAAGAMIGTLVGRALAGRTIKRRPVAGRSAAHTGTQSIQIYPAITRDGGAGVFLHFGR